MNIQIGSLIKTSDNKIGMVFADENTVGIGFCEIRYGKFDRQGNPFIELSRISRDWVNPIFIKLP